jgi:hypothetical protein
MAWSAGLRKTTWGKARAAFDGGDLRDALGASRQALEMLTDKMWKWLAKNGHGMLTLPLPGRGAGTGPAQPLRIPSGSHGGGDYIRPPRQAGSVALLIKRRDFPRNCSALLKLDGPFLPVQKIGRRMT